jgi:hypothetical protein
MGLRVELARGNLMPIDCKWLMEWLVDFGNGFMIKSFRARKSSAREGEPEKISSVYFRNG